MKTKINFYYIFIFIFNVLIISSCESDSIKLNKSNVSSNEDNLNLEKVNIKTMGYYFHQFKSHYNTKCSFERISSQDSFVFNEKFVFKVRSINDVRSNLIVGRDTFGNVCSVKLVANKQVRFELNIFYDSLLNCSLGLLNSFSTVHGSGLFFVENEKLFYMFKDRYDLNNLNGIAGIMELNKEFEVIREVKISDNEMLYYGLVNYDQSTPKSTSIYIPHHSKMISENYPFSSLLDTLEMSEYFDYCGELLITSKSPECFLPIWIWQGYESVLYNQYKK